MYSITTATKKVKALKKRIKIIQGGTSASKTISILIILIDRAQRKHQEKELTSVVSESIPHLKRGAIRDFKNIMQSQGYWREANWNATDSVYTFESGNQIEFFSTDNADKLRGARRHWLFMNEANNITYEAFDQLEVRTKLGVYIDYNPTSEFWATEQLKDKRDDVDFIILTYKDNEALAEEIVQAIEQRRSNKNWWRVYGEGQIGVVEGRIYPDWPIIDTIPPEAKLVRRGLDYGYTNDPTALIDIYKWNDAYIWDEVLYRKGLANKQIADVALNQDDPDVLTVGDSAEPKSNDELAAYGVAIMGANKGPGSVNHGIQIVQNQKILVTKRSTNIIRENRRYMWKTDKDGKVLNVPEDIWNHAMDAGRYAMETLNLDSSMSEIEKYMLQQARNSAGLNFAR